MSTENVITLGNLSTSDFAVGTIEPNRVNVSKPVYEVSGTGETVLSVVEAVLPLNVVNAPHALFSVAAGVVSYSGPTRQFAVSYGFTGRATTGARSTARVALYHNGTEVTRSRSYTYHRMTQDDEGSSFGRVIITLSAGDTVSLQARWEAANDRVTAMNSFTNLVIEAS